MVELGLEHEGNDRDVKKPASCSPDLGNLCSKCAAARDGYPRHEHARTTFKADCSQCKQQRMISHYSNFDWDDIEIDTQAKENH